MLENFPRELARLVSVLSRRRPHEKPGGAVGHDSDEGRPDSRIPFTLLAGDQDRGERTKRQQEDDEVTELQIDDRQEHHGGENDDADRARNKPWGQKFPPTNGSTFGIVSPEWLKERLALIARSTGLG